MLFLSYCQGGFPGRCQGEVDSARRGCNRVVHCSCYHLHCWQQMKRTKKYCFKVCYVSTTGRLAASLWGSSKAVKEYGDMDPRSLHALVKWCYTTRLEVPSSCAQACTSLLERLKLQSLADQLAAARRKRSGNSVCSQDIYIAQLLGLLYCKSLSHPEATQAPFFGSFPCMVAHKPSHQHHYNLETGDQI